MARYGGFSPPFSTYDLARLFSCDPDHLNTTCFGHGDCGPIVVSEFNISMPEFCFCSGFYYLGSNCQFTFFEIYGYGTLAWSLPLLLASFILFVLCLLEIGAEIRTLLFSQWNIFIGKLCLLFFSIARMLYYISWVVCTVDYQHGAYRLFLLTFLLGLFALGFGYCCLTLFWFGLVDAAHSLELKRKPPFIIFSTVLTLLSISICLSGLAVIIWNIAEPTQAATNRNRIAATLFLTQIFVCTFFGFIFGIWGYVELKGMGDKLISWKNFLTLGMTVLMLSLGVLMLCFVLGYAEIYPWPFFAIFVPFGVLEMLAAFIFFVVLKKRYGSESWFFGYFKILKNGYVPGSKSHSTHSAHSGRSGRRPGTAVDLSGSESVRPPTTSTS